MRRTPWQHEIFFLSKAESGNRLTSAMIRWFLGWVGLGAWVLGCLGAWVGFA